MPSTPAATASAMAWVPWACAVTGSPCRCASSTAARSTPASNWARSCRVPGVIVPPLAMILMTSTPRSTCSRTAARTPNSVGSATPSKKWQCPPGLVIGGPAATTVGWSSRPRRLQRQVAAVAQVAHRRHPGPQRRPASLGHRRHGRAVVTASQIADRVQAGVERQVDMRVHQPWQQRRPVEVHEARAVGHIAAGLHRPDHRAIRTRPAGSRSAPNRCRRTATTHGSLSAARRSETMRLVMPTTVAARARRRIRGCTHARYVSPRLQSRGHRAIPRGGPARCTAGPRAAPARRPAGSPPAARAGRSAPAPRLPAAGGTPAACPGRPAAMPDRSVFVPLVVASGAGAVTADSR